MGQGVKSSLSQQEILSLQVPLTVGVVSVLMGSAQQEDIEGGLRRLIERGQNIMGLLPDPPSTEPKYDSKIPDLSTTTAPSASAV